MRTLDIVLLTIGAVCFLLETIITLRPSRPTSVDLVALGLLAWILVPLITLLRQ